MMIHLIQFLKSSLEMIKSSGDKTEIDWLNRDEEDFYEKLATPDVTVSAF